MPLKKRTVAISVLTGSDGLEYLCVQPMGIGVAGLTHGEEVTWIAYGPRITSFTISFNYGDSCPFNWGQSKSRTSVNNIVNSDEPNTGGPNPTPFAYTITVQLALGAGKPGYMRQRAMAIDPEVVVDDGLPPLTGDEVTEANNEVNDFLRGSREFPLERLRRFLPKKLFPRIPGPPPNPRARLAKKKAVANKTSAVRTKTVSTSRGKRTISTRSKKRK
jgi:hypothetical protein